MGIPNSILTCVLNTHPLFVFSSRLSLQDSYTIEESCLKKQRHLGEMDNYVVLSSTIYLLAVVSPVKDFTFLNFLPLVVVSGSITSKKYLATTLRFTALQSIIGRQLWKRSRFTWKKKQISKLFQWKHLPHLFFLQNAITITTITSLWITCWGYLSRYLPNSKLTEGLQCNNDVLSF